VSKIKSLYQKLPFGMFMKIFAIELARKLFMKSANYYFAQWGEDITSTYLLGKSQTGFYIDIGSNDPVHYSNTFKLYLQGWKGILVDGNNKLIEKTKKIRKKDIAVHGIVSNKKEETVFYIAEDSLMSSIHPDQTSKPLEKITAVTITLDEIIERYLPKNQNIDLLSIDVEGHDFEVLQSIDLNKYRPSLIIVEDLGHWCDDLSNIYENKFVRYLKSFYYYIASRDKKNLYFFAVEHNKPVEQRIESSAALNR
jgi:FkbM family methyltransferase